MPILVFPIVFVDATSHALNPLIAVNVTRSWCGYFSILFASFFFLLLLCCSLPPHYVHPFPARPIPLPSFRIPLVMDILWMFCLIYLVLVVPLFPLLLLRLEAKSLIFHMKSHLSNAMQLDKMCNSGWDWIRMLVGPFSWPPTRSGFSCLSCHKSKSPTS